MQRNDNDFKLFNDAQDQAAEMLEAAGGKYIAKVGEPSVLGFCIHEVGTARMGDDRKSSVMALTVRACDYITHEYARKV